MIGIVGFMSGGKSYYAVEQMLHLLATNHIIASNIRLNCREVSRYLGVPCVLWKPHYFFISDDETGFHIVKSDEYETWPCGSPRGSSDYDARMVHIFLDEVSSMFDSMISAADSSVQKVATWARHSRKRGQEIYLIMQFPSELHKRLRNHIVEYISCVNSSTIKIPLLGTGLPAFLKGLSIRQKFLADFKTPIGDSKWQRFNPSIFRCYNTAQIVVGSSDISLTEYQPIDFSLVKSRQLFFIGLCITVLSVIVNAILVGVFLYG